MTVDTIMELINTYRYGDITGVDRISANVILSARRMNAVDVDTLLNYIKAVTRNSNSAHVIFLSLTRISKPSIEQMAASEFCGDNSFPNYSEQLNELHDFIVTGNGQRFLTANNLNVYTRLYHVGATVYCERKQLVLYHLRQVEVDYLRFMFGQDYIASLVYPTNISCAELAYAYSHPTALQFGRSANLFTTVRACNDFHPAPDPDIVDYSIGKITTGTLITLVIRNLGKWAYKDIVNIGCVLFGQNIDNPIVTKIDNYRVVVYIEEVCT